MTHPRVLVVTGASSGIGRAVAVRASGEGDHVVLVARGQSALDEAAAECVDAGAASVIALPADVGDDAAVARMVARTLSQHSRIDVVVNAAGVVAYGRTEDFPPEVFDGVIRTNLLGAANVARHVVPVFRRQRAGTLLIVGSVLGHIAAPTMSPYVISKWGVRALARQLAIENRDVPGVRIQHVAPGGVDTPIYDQGANYAGYAGRPPPPAASADHVAAQVLRRLGAFPLPLPQQLSLLNHGMTFGFRVLPRVYDALVTTIFPLGATDLRRPVGPTPGNVLESHPDDNRTDGAHGSSLAGVARNVLVRARRAVPGG